MWTNDVRYMTFDVGRGFRIPHLLARHGPFAASSRVVQGGDQYDQRVLLLVCRAYCQSFKPLAPKLKARTEGRMFELGGESSRKALRGHYASNTRQKPCAQELHLFTPRFQGVPKTAPTIVEH